MTNEAKMQQTVSAPKTKKRKIASLDRKKARAGWIFVLPFIIGFLLIIQDDPFFKNIGKYMTYIPLSIIALQVLLGILFKIALRFKK